MKKIAWIIAVCVLSATVLLNQGCINECGECFSPPEQFVFEIVDKTTGANLFSNGTYQPSQIEVINTLNGSFIEFSFIGEDSLNLITVYSIGWKTEKVDLLLRIANDSICNMFVDAERLSEDCCSFTKYNEKRIYNAQYEQLMESYIYRILIE